MSTFDAQSFYFSGQGVVMLGSRDPLTGQPLGLKPIGNVSALKLSMSPSVNEHRESQTGSRGVDARFQTELKVGASMDFESLIAENLRDGLRGNLIKRLAGTVTAESVKLFLGKVMPLKFSLASSVVVKRGATTLTPFVSDSAPWDYKVNGDAGSLGFNDGSIQPTDKLTTLGSVPTAITVGALTRVTVTVPVNTQVDDYMVVTGLTGADAALLNGRPQRIAAINGTTSVDLAINTTGRTITLGSPLAVFDRDNLSVDYSYAAQNQVDALTNNGVDKWLRFEGLNTADENRPVIVDIFRFSVDPLKELSLIGDEIGKFTLEGNVLVDPLQTVGSKYFRMIQTR